jgi:hypothetical protein
MLTITPDRPDGMEYISARQTIALRNLGVTGFAAAQPGAFLQQTRSGGPVDGAVHPASTQQRVVGGIDNGINRQCGDIGLNDFDGSFHGFLISAF